jgi:hypothetical protein
LARIWDHFQLLVKRGLLVKNELGKMEQEEIIGFAKVMEAERLALISADAASTE